MNPSNVQLKEYLIGALKLSGFQLLLLFGPLIFLSVLMQFIARQNEKYSTNLLGRNAFLLLFGWIGVSVHELGHALFALLFGHKITKIKLFSPNSEDGTLGYVDHSYNPKNPYHQAGNFFIGIGPILFGSLMLFLLTWFMFDINTFKLSSIDLDSSLFTSISGIKTAIIAIVKGLHIYVQSIWQSEKSSWWKLLILGYALFAIGSSITLSKADISSAWKGFLMIVLLIIVFNLSTFWITDFSDRIIRFIGQGISAFCFVLMLSILINLAFMIIIGIANAFRKR